MNQKTGETLDITPIRTGRPRLDKSSRILARFYEPLFLLRALGQTRGVHTRRERDPDDVIETRRRFLDHLCFICDFEKGGKSCTALGLEECVDTYKFWLASNEKHSDIAGYLKDVLKFLYHTSHLDETERAAREPEFTHFCARFAQSRIHGERKCVQTQAQICIEQMQGALNRRDKLDGLSEEFDADEFEVYGALIPVLKQILDQKDGIELCYFSYQNRRSDWMEQLQNLASRAEPTPDLGRRSPFYLVHHYIGRLAHHIRAPRELIQDAHQMEPILQTHTIEIVDLLPGVQIPVRDTHTNLKGILNRMFRKDNVEEKSLVKEGLIKLDKASGVSGASGIFSEFLRCYKQSGVDVDVHAEIKVLEHFYRSKLRFVGNDRFIACSKPACLCCELYFKYHPARMVIPSSHKNVWPKWSPPQVEYGVTLNDQALQQRKILSKMTEDLREEIINQVLQRSRHIDWHPDSRTGITDSHIMNHQAFSMDSDYSEISERESDLDSLNGSESEIWSDSEEHGGISVSF